ncbi:MAG: TetR/AcrR family transcriptional regulator [Solirubrobacterales bacterium]
MITPWGDTEELRRQRLRPGTQPKGRQATITHQRRRLFAATVAAVAERGYAEMTVADLVKGSGVARADFYRLFSSKQECFLAAVDELYEEGMRSVRLGYNSEEQWEDGIRAAFGRLLELLVSQPAAARMCMVDIYEAGVEGGERADRGAAGFERLLARSVARSGARSGLPRAILGAIVGGIHLLIHDRLRRGVEAELPRTMSGLVEWALSYEAPPSPLRRPKRQVKTSRRSSTEDPAERLLWAVAETVADKGYGAVSVNELAPRARTSLRTLYQSFGGKEEAFIACFRMVSDHTLTAAATAYGQASDWANAVGAANEAVLAYLASEPDFARVAMVEVLAAGPAAVEARDEAIKPFAQLLQPGYELLPKVPSIAAEAMAFGVYSLIRRQILLYGPATLPRIGPTATFFDLAPFLGSERAAAIANGRGR